MDTAATLRELGPGVPVRLCVRAGASAGSYPGQVVDKGPASLVVSAWAPDAETLYVSLGTHVIVGFPATHGWGEFQSRVAGSYLRGAVTELLLSRPDRVVYRQRRKYARLAVTLPVHAWLAADEQAALCVLGHTEDIGREGLRASFSTSLPGDGPVVVVIAPSHGLQEIRLAGRPVWHEATGGPGEEWHRYGLRFLPMASDTRQRLSALLAHLKAGGGDQPGGPGLAAPHAFSPPMGGP